MNLYQKLATIRKQVEVLKKTKSGFGYNYTPEDEILAKITVQLDKLHLSCLPRIVPGTLSVEKVEFEKTKVNKKSGDTYNELSQEMLVQAEMVFTWIDNDNPDEKLEVPWIIVGQQSDASQAFGSGLTYVTRYFLLKFFQVATVDDDPDQFRSKQKAAEAAEDATIAEGVIKTVNDKVHSYIDNAKDAEKARDKVMTIVKKYVPSGDYTKIKDSVLASRLLRDITDNLKEEK